MYDGYSIYDEPFSSYYGNSTSSSSAADSIVAAIFAFIAAFSLFFIIAGIVSIVVLIAKWKLFKKAGKKPWEALIAIHNTIVEMELGGIETYWYFLQFIPFVGQIAIIAIHFWRCIALSKSFGKSTAFGVLMGFFPFVGYPILAFGNSQYIGPQTNSNVFSQSNNNYNNTQYNNYSNNMNYNSAPNNMNQNFNSANTAQNNFVNANAPQQPVEPTYQQAQPVQQASPDVVNQAAEPIQPVQESLFDAAPSVSEPVQLDSPAPSDIPNTESAPSVNSDNDNM